MGAPRIREEPMVQREETVAMCQEPWDAFLDQERWEFTIEKRRDNALREEERDWDDCPERWEIYDDEE